MSDVSISYELFPLGLTFHHIFITVFPSVSTFPEDSNSFLGDTQTFTCSAMGGPGNTFSWTRLSNGVTVGNMSSLTVSVEGADDGGMYRCEVTNLAGSASDTVTLNGKSIISLI